MSKGQNNRRFNGIAMGTVMIFVFLLVACQGAPPTVSNTSLNYSTDGASGSTKTKLMVFPFVDLGKIFGIETNVRNPITGRQYLTGPVPDQIPDYLTSKLISVLQKRSDVSVLTSDQDLKYDSLSVGESALAVLRPQINRIATKADADLVMLGHVYRFRQRVGSPLSITRPASVAYDIVLMDVQSGRVLWKNHLDETQKSLSEDLGQFGKFLRRGASWVTAEELASERIDYQIHSLPQRFVRR